MNRLKLSRVTVAYAGVLATFLVSQALADVGDIWYVAGMIATLTVGTFAVAGFMPDPDTKPVPNPTDVSDQHVDLGVPSTMPFDVAMMVSALNDPDAPHLPIMGSLWMRIYDQPLDQSRPLKEIMEEIEVGLKGYW